MEGNGNGGLPAGVEILTEAELMASGRRAVRLASGRAVLIRRLKRRDLAMISKTIPDISALATAREGERGLRVEQVAEADDLSDKVLVAAVLKPKLSLDPEAGPTPGDFTVAEQAELMSAILEHSGFTKAKAEEVLPLSSPSA